MTTGFIPIRRRFRVRRIRQVGILAKSLFYTGVKTVSNALRLPVTNHVIYTSRPPTSVVAGSGLECIRTGTFPHYEAMRGSVFQEMGFDALMGNTSMVPRTRVIWAERLLRFALRGMNAIGPIIRLLSRDDRWKYPTFGLSRKLCWWLHRTNRGRTKPDAFVVEVYNPGEEPVRMQLAMDFPPETRKDLAHTVQIQPRFRTTLDFPPGYSRHDFERRLFQSVTESGMQFTISLTPQADTTARLVFLLADFVKYRHPVSRKEPQIKCLVWGS